MFYFLILNQSFTLRVKVQNSRDDTSENKLFCFSGIISLKYKNHMQSVCQIQKFTDDDDDAI